MNLERERLRTWLREAMLQTGDSPTALARRAGLAQSTITRFLGNDDAPMIGLRSITKIAQAAGVAPPGFDLKNGAGAKEIDPDDEPEAREFDFDDVASDRLKQAVRCLFDGRETVSAWVLQSYAIRLAGYLPGDVLISDRAKQPTPGVLVSAQLFLYHHATAETVFRIYEPPYLLAASDHPALWRPTLVDNHHAIIKGVVTESIRITW